MRSRATIAGLTLWALSPLSVSSPQPVASGGAVSRPEVLVLGVFHMNNPGQDIVNAKVDDVLAPKRQAEMAELIAVLRKFQPTKIAVERNPNDARLSKDYPEYVAGTRQLTRNEIEQIGYRLARELGHKTVYGVDADGEFQYPRVVTFAKATGRSGELDAIMRDIQGMVKAQDAYLASHTLLETLLWENSEQKVAEAVGYYYRQSHFGEAWDWAGADFLTEWFRRNMRIYSNVVEIADSPNERVLVIFGLGHLGWLRQAIANDPTLRLRTLADFAR
jgi:hypothetical protein